VTQPPTPFVTKLPAAVIVIRGQATSGLRGLDVTVSDAETMANGVGVGAVSYTHLTLPTKA